MDQHTLNFIPSDKQFTEHRIIEVVSDPDGWTVKVMDGAHLFVTNKYQSTPPAENETMRAYGRGHGYPVRGIVIGGRVYMYTAGDREESAPKPRDLLVELNNLRRASRAMAQLPSEVEVFNEVKPEDMRRVLTARGWTFKGTLPWPGDPNRMAFETYDHPTATGADSFGIVNFVKVPMDATAADWRSRVYEWAAAVSTRHGDVSPAEILAETL